MTDERKARIARNETVFRALNEDLEDSVLRRREATDLAGFVCECGDSACEDIVRLDVSTYESIRADPLRFFLVPGHEAPDAEDIVDRTAGYLVVRKHQDVAAVAEDADRRTDT